MSEVPRAGVVEQVTEERVRHIALLSRLELSDAEVATMSTSLSGLVRHINQLEKVDTSGVEPTSHPVGISNVLREDCTGPSLSVEDALKNAPETQPPFFRVPQII